MNALVIANTGIRQDAEGRFSLNDLHRASGATATKRPPNWLANEQTKELIAETDRCWDSSIAPVATARGGKMQGTFVCKELVYAYAMWISPKFHLQVIRTFDAAVTGKAPEFAQGAFREFQFTRQEMLDVVTRMTESSLKLAGLMGFEGNQQRFHADKAVRKQIGVGPLELLGVDSLPSSNDELSYTPAQLGKRFDVSAQAFNKLLERCGLQTAQPKGQSDLRWLPTEKRPTARRNERHLPRTQQRRASTATTVEGSCADRATQNRQGYEPAVAACSQRVILRRLTLSQSLISPTSTNPLRGFFIAWRNV